MSHITPQLPPEIWCYIIDINYYQFCVLVETKKSLGRYFARFYHKEKFFKEAIVGHLIKGKNVNFVNDDVIYPIGYSALMYTCQHKLYENIPILVEAGADVNLVNNFNGYSALMIACRKNQPESVTLLIEAVNGLH